MSTVGIAEDFSRCFQIMECEDEGLFDLWITQWSDLVALEVIPVIRPKETALRFSSEK